MLEVGPRLAALLWGLLVCSTFGAFLVFGVLTKLIEALDKRWTRPNTSFAVRLSVSTADEMAAMLKRMEDLGR